MGIKVVVISLIAAVVLGGGAYYVINKNKDEKSNNQTNSQNSERTSLNSLLGQNKNVKCEFSQTDEQGSKSSGTVYVAGERMRGNFTVQVNGQAEQKSNILQDKEYNYIWAENAANGIKTKVVDVEAAADQQASNGQTQSVDQDTEYDYKCVDWSVDEAQFQVPGGIQFTDFSAQLEQAGQAQQDAAGAAQAACAQISDASIRAACESGY